MFREPPFGIWRGPGEETRDFTWSWPSSFASDTETSNERNGTEKRREMPRKNDERWRVRKRLVQTAMPKQKSTAAMEAVPTTATRTSEPMFGIPHCTGMSTPTKRLRQKFSTLPKRSSNGSSPNTNRGRAIVFPHRVVGTLVSHRRRRTLWRKRP